MRWHYSPVNAPIVKSQNGWKIKPPPTEEELSHFRFVFAQDGAVKVETTLASYTTNWTQLGNVWQNTNQARADIEWQLSQTRNAEVEKRRVYRPASDYNGVPTNQYITNLEVWFQVVKP